MKHQLTVLAYAALIVLPYTALAQYSPLLNIPGIADSTTGLNTFLNVVYIFAISAAALIAVVRLVLAGFQYLLSDVVTNKQDAKKNIRSALVGLFIILTAVVILRTINPGLVNLSTLEPLNLPSYGQQVNTVEDTFVCDIQQLTTGAGCPMQSSQVNEYIALCNSYLEENGLQNNEGAGLGRVGSSGVYKCYTGNSVPVTDPDLEEYADQIVLDPDVLNYAQIGCGNNPTCTVYFVAEDLDLEDFCESKSGNMDETITYEGFTYYPCIITND